MAKNTKIDPAVECGSVASRLPREQIAKLCNLLMLEGPEGQFAGMMISRQTESLEDMLIRAAIMLEGRKRG